MGASEDVQLVVTCEGRIERKRWTDPALRSLRDALSWLLTLLS